MPSVMSYNATWTGFPGAPGYTRFHFAGTSTQSFIDAWGNGVRTFFFALAGLMKTGWQVAVSPTVEENDVYTGRLIAQWAMTTAPAVVSGSNSTDSFAGGVGAFLTWNTNVIWQGHRVQGRTFLVPLAGVADVDGTIKPGVITQINAAAAALIATQAPGLVIWSRKYSPPPNSTQIDGNTALVASAITRDKTGILRSRRD